MTRIPQRAFSGGIMSPGMFARRDIGKWSQGLKDAANVVLRAEGGAQSRAGTLVASGYDNSTADGAPWLIPFEASQDDTYMLEFGEQVMRVLKNGSYVLSSAVGSQSVTSITTANPARIEMVDATAASQFTVGRLVFLSDPNGTSVFSGAVLEVTAISSEFITFNIVGGVAVDTTSGDWGSIGSGATLSEVYQITTPYEIEDMPTVQFTQDVDTMFLVRQEYDVRQLVRTADDSWAISLVDFVPDIGQVTGVSASPLVGSGGITYNYRVSAVDAETGEEGLPSAVASTTNDLAIAGHKNRVTWSALTGADFYRVYKDFNGIYGFIGITEATAFDDENITADTSDNPQTARNPFSTPSDLPSVVAFIEQRLTLAATANNPQAVEMSASTAPLNFNRPLTPGASDAISFRMRSQQLNRVRHIISGDRPLILTSGAEWYLATENDAALAPGNFALRSPTSRGSAQTPRPVVIGTNLLHVTRDGNTVREFSLSDFRDTASADLTLLARHLFRGKTITSMAYAQSPDSVVWLTLATGELYSLTYLSEHEIWGWTRHEIAGTDVRVKQVAVVTEGAYDTPYFVVERTLYGGTVTLVERLDTREFETVSDCYFVDAGSKYQGAATQVLRGYLHLRGEPVEVLADGNVLERVSVSDQGTVDMRASYSKAAVGLGYDAYVITLEADMGDQIREVGSSMGRFVSSHEVAVKAVETRGIAVGIEGGILNEVKEFSGTSPIPLATKTYVVLIDGDWTRDQSIEVRQVYPLPMTITAIGPSWTLGE